LSIADYCKRFKRMADDLADLGETVTDRTLVTLVLNVLCVLNEKYASIGRHLRRSRPFTYFLEVCDDLTLEKLTMAEQAATPSTALLAGTSTPSQRPPAPTQRQSNQPGSGSGSGGGKGNRGGGRSDGSSGKGGRGKCSRAPKGTNSAQPIAGDGDSSTRSSTAPSSATNAQWPSFYNPTGAIQMWPVQRPPAPPPAQQAVAPAPNQQALQAQQQALQGQVQPVLQP